MSQLQSLIKNSDEDFTKILDQQEVMF
jgi:hypothetical protein